ncbi:MAG: hypothetical protein GKC53_05900 [Neisseriaceae bacterium]|nr:MAG: hypothetical protein GKC53_05900 [Neisseriaceae bacterium]
MLSTPILPKNYETGHCDFKLSSMNEAILKESLLISSFDLYHELNKNLTRMNKKKELSIEKYTNRMTTRSTPFGIFL